MEDDLPARHRLHGEPEGDDATSIHSQRNLLRRHARPSRHLLEHAPLHSLPGHAQERAEQTGSLVAQLEQVEMGSPVDFRNFVAAVIDESSFNNIMAYIDFAKNSTEAEIVSGGKGDKSKGYFVEPTVVLTTNPRFKLMEEEIFGPVLTVYVYDDAEIDQTLDLVDTTSPYALTGAIFAQDRKVIDVLARRLRHAAGNFYINDKPTGAVVSQQPFGGGRASGTNDKAGSMLNLLRWVSARSIKENFVPPTDYRYPFMQEA